MKRERITKRQLAIYVSGTDVEFGSISDENVFLNARGTSFSRMEAENVNNEINQYGSVFVLSDMYDSKNKNEMARLQSNFTQAENQLMLAVYQNLTFLNEDKLTFLGATIAGSVKGRIMYNQAQAGIARAVEELQESQSE